MKGLECLAGKMDCGNCGYKDADGNGKGFNYCVYSVAADALELLKAHIPRVMTLDEVAELEEHQFVWIEHNNSDEPVYCLEIVQLCGIVSINMEIAFNTPSSICFVYTKDYNKNYRFWTSRPTDKQREETPWEK